MKKEKNVTKRKEGCCTYIHDGETTVCIARDTRYGVDNTYSATSRPSEGDSYDENYGETVARLKALKKMCRARISAGKEDVIEAAMIFHAAYVGLMVSVGRLAHDAQLAETIAEDLEILRDVSDEEISEKLSEMKGSFEILYEATAAIRNIFEGENGIAMGLMDTVVAAEKTSTAMKKLM